MSIELTTPAKSNPTYVLHKSTKEHATYSEKTKLITGKWTVGKNQPKYTIPKSGTYFVNAQVKGTIGYHQVQLQYTDVNGKYQGMLACQADYDETRRGRMIQATTLVHFYAGQSVEIYVHTNTEGIELDADLWVYCIDED